MPMNQVAEEMNNALMHYGTPRHSGRYPYGSGDNPYQRTGDLLSRIETLKKSGWTETPENIMNEFGLTTTQYRAQKGLATDLRWLDKAATIRSMKEDGLSNSEIGRKLGMNESSVRLYLDPTSDERRKLAMNTADFIRSQIEEHGMVDIGAGVENELRVSREKMNQALAILESEGYPIYGGGVPQPTNPGQQTNMKVICPKGTEHKEIYNYENVHSLNEYITRDDGVTFEKKFHYPESMDSKRMLVRYAEEGGLERDGVVEIRRGVQDLSLGESHYSQVRILVDGTHYIKGMAVYSDDMPDGVDIVFNTNKPKGTPALGPKDNTVLKNIKNDPDNPFGSAIKDVKKGGQYWYEDADGNKKLGLINKRADEGDWTEWKDKLPAQFLSKQSLSLAKKQLNLALKDKTDEYDEICSLTNPTLKKHLLGKFADECDAASVNLQAAALPGQKYHVIIPVNSLKDTEVYAPNYENGQQLALIRYPHGGIFEIPILTVNNKNALAKKIVGTDTMDAVGINKKNADKLSGADFDGDTVMCIPTHNMGSKVRIINKDTLKELEDFDPKMAYPGRPGMKVMRDTQKQMGVVSNLITDMTLKGATYEELAKAVRHSMTVIDAEKHGLDYKRSEIENDIASLKRKYQTQVDSDGKTHVGGASTLISRSKGQQPVDKRQGTPVVNVPGAKMKINGKYEDVYDPSRPKGALIYKPADDLTYTVTTTNKRTGETKTVTKKRTQVSTKMAETDDAYTLISDYKSPMEYAYADYANSMKKLANKARVEKTRTGKIAYSANAKSVYAKEVKDLNEKLNNATLNKPREREAIRKANVEVKAKKQDNPDMTKEEVKKASQQALAKYRNSVGSVSRRDRSIKITDREWDAIQSGAISENTLTKILDNTDIDDLRRRATPKSTTVITASKANKIESMRNSGHSLSEIAKATGVSTSTISNYIKDSKEKGDD